jgi:hypothetical protein
LPILKGHEKSSLEGALFNQFKGADSEKVVKKLKTITRV